jgi:hypothetical protein
VNGTPAELPGTLVASNSLLGFLCSHKPGTLDQSGPLEKDPP